MTYKNIEEEIANRIVDLDEDAYKSCKSDMGKLFSGSRANSVQQIVQGLKHDKSADISNVITVIGNMIETIDTTDEHDRLMKEYDALQELITSYVGDGVTADNEMNEYSLPVRYKNSNSPHLIIAIGRELGSGGREIGRKLAHNLGIGFYDRQILENANKELGLDSSQKDEYKDAPGGFINAFNRTRLAYLGITTSDALFFKQSELIINLAQKEDCVIIGRCADAVLEAEGIACHSIYIGAPLEARIARTMKVENISEDEARKLVSSTDRERRDYYEHYTGRKWGHSGNYDLTINSAALGVEGTVDMIERMIDKTIEASRNI